MEKEMYLKLAGVLYDTVIPTQRDIRNKCEKYIQMALDEHNGCIDFNDYDPDEFVSVPYDGGNHPEYASNCFSVVNGVFIHKDGDICLNTEDCSEYALSSVDWDDVYNIATYIRDQILK